MAPKNKPYHPSVYNLGKYANYLGYFREYLKYRDFNSLIAAWNYLLRGKSTSKSWQATSKLGKFHIRKDTNDFLFINYTYEKKIRDYLEKESEKMTCFIDIGACIGEFCVWLAQKGIRCIAFEPVNYEAAKNNFILNHLEDKIELYNYGLGSEEKKVFFEVREINTGASRMDQNRKDEPGNIQITTLDKILPPDAFNDTDYVVIKLDVEGMELDVLEGAKDTIRNTKNLSIIYEHIISGKDTVGDALSQLGNFEFIKIDFANTLARKIPH